MSHTFHELKIADIKIGDRFRKDYGKIDELAQAIKQRGRLLEPIVVDQDLNLLAGGRRLQACTSLGWETIPAQYITEVDELTAREIELEENLHRKNLTWQEESKLTLEIDKLYRLKHGQARSGRPTGVIIGSDGKVASHTIEDKVDRNQGWSQSQTADALGVTQSLVSQNISMARAIEVMPSLENETSLVNARRKITRIIEDLEREKELRRRSIEVTQVESSVWQGFSESLITKLETDSVDLIITDPPYGDDNLPFGQPHRTQKEFDDSPESTIALLRSIIPELRRVLKPSGHLYAFFGPKLWQQTIDLWRNGGFDVRSVVCIWHKTGGATGTVNWDKDFAPVWEPFIFAHNGERRLLRKRDNLFAYPPDRGSERVHANQKPLGLISELIELSSDAGELVFDPFGGSGTTAVAAKQMGRRYLTFELSESFCNIIKQRLINTVEGDQKDAATGEGTSAAQQNSGAQDLDEIARDVFETDNS